MLIIKNNFYYRLIGIYSLKGPTTTRKKNLELLTQFLVDLFSCCYRRKKKKWLKWAKLSTLAAYESLSCLCFSHPWEIVWGKQKFLPVKFLVVLVLFISRINANTNKQCQSFISFYISLSMYVLNREFSNSGGKFNRKSWVMFPFLRSFIVVSIWWFLFFYMCFLGHFLNYVDLFSLLRTHVWHFLWSSV